MNVCLLCILFNTDDRFVFDDEDVGSPTNAPSLPAAGRPTSAPGRVTQEALKKVLHRMNKILAKLPRDMEAIRNSQQKLEGKVKALENSCAECKKTLHGTKAAEDLPKTSQKEPGNPNPTPNPNPNPNPSPGKNKGLQKISDRIVMVEKSQRAMRGNFGKLRARLRAILHRVVKHHHYIRAINKKIRSCCANRVGPKPSIGTPNPNPNPKPPTATSRPPLHRPRPHFVRPGHPFGRPKSWFRHKLHKWHKWHKWHKGHKGHKRGHKGHKGHDSSDSSDSSDDDD